MINLNHNKISVRGGQSMIMTVLLLSGAILGATSIVGLLLVYEVRHSGNISNSTRALSAADSGLQCALMKDKEGESSARDCGNLSDPIELGTCSSPGNINCAVYYVEYINDPDTGLPVGARSTGVSNRTARAFQTSL